MPLGDPCRLPLSETNRQYVCQEMTWDILIRSGQITIGCQRHSYTDWWEFTDNQILKMHPKALAWWRQTKKPLFELLIALEQWTPPAEEKDVQIKSADGSHIIGKDQNP